MNEPRISDTPERLLGETLYLFNTIWKLSQEVTEEEMGDQYLEFILNCENSINVAAREIAELIGEQ